MYKENASLLPWHTDDSIFVDTLNKCSAKNGTWATKTGLVACTKRSLLINHLYIINVYLFYLFMETSPVKIKANIKNKKIIDESFLT